MALVLKTVSSIVVASYGFKKACPVIYGLEAGAPSSQLAAFGCQFPARNNNWCVLASFLVQPHRFIPGAASSLHSWCGLVASFLVRPRRFIPGAASSFHSWCSLIASFLVRPRHFIPGAASSLHSWCSLIASFLVRPSRFIPGAA
jgi:hypothetical protein